MPDVRMTFHMESERLRSDVVGLATLAEGAIQAGTAALLDGERAMIQRVVEGDESLDRLADALEERACVLIARQQPTASDLRALVTVLWVVRELERIGDNMVNVANAASAPSLQPVDPPVRSLIERMRDQAVAQLRVATDAFVVSDGGAAAKLEEMDDVMDSLQLDLLQTVVFDAGDKVSVDRAVKLALISRYFERIADLTVNIGDRVRFMTRGEFDHYGHHREATPSAPT